MLTFEGTGRYRIALTWEGELSEEQVNTLNTVEGYIQHFLLTAEEGMSLDVNRMDSRGQFRFFSRIDPEADADRVVERNVQAIELCDENKQFIEDHLAGIGFKNYSFFDPNRGGDGRCFLILTPVGYMAGYPGDFLRTREDGLVLPIRRARFHRIFTEQAEKLVQCCYCKGHFPESVMYNINKDDRCCKECVEGTRT